MKDFLEQHKVVLTVRGPVFIGSGKDVMKKEYLLLQREKQVAVMDIGKLYQMACKKGRGKRFEQFMLENRGPGLYKWLREEQLFEEAKGHCVRYMLNLDPASDVQRTMEIKSFIKDSYGNPYVPGSTLKGMLRNILAAEKLLKDDVMRSRMGKELSREISVKKKRQFYLSSVNRTLNERLFHTLDRPKTKSQDAVNDELSGFIVSDSEPMELKQLVLAQKVEYGTDGGTHTLNLWRESLRPGTKISFTLTVDRNTFPQIKERLSHAIELFADVYNQCFLQAFPGMEKLQPHQVLLGGGAGFVSKTLIYPLLGKKEGVESAVEIFKQTGVPLKHQHHKDRGLGVSPHILKCTWYGGRTLQMGLCDFSME